jgi:hypothetical protein
MSEQTNDKQPDRFVTIPVPEGGFTPEQLAPYMRMGFKVWGVVPMVASAPRTDLIVPGQRPVDHLVLDRDVSTVPLNLLAHHIIQAREGKKGLEHLSQMFFGLSLGALAQARAEAERRFNEQR